jgi:hypothetical protein
MKKAELTVGEEYAYSTSQDWTRFKWGDTPHHVRLLGFPGGSRVDLEWLDGSQPFGGNRATTRNLVATWADAKPLIDAETRRWEEVARRREVSRELAQRIRAWADRRDLDTYGLTAGTAGVTVPTELLTALADAAKA